MTEKQEEISVFKPLVTKEEFTEFVAIQESGVYNMLDPRARQLTLISKEDWIYILNNYGKLKSHYDI
jgi:hypothetical protein